MAACGSEGRVFSVAGVGSAASLAVFSASCGVLLSFSGMEKAEGVFTLSASLIALKWYITAYDRISNTKKRLYLLDFLIFSIISLLL